METYWFQLFPRTDEHATLRWLDGGGMLLDERPLDRAQMRRLIAEIGDGYGGVSPKLGELGGRLFQWLDGAGEGWLTRLKDRPLSLHVDVEEGLRHLPWELLFDTGRGFLGGSPIHPFTPVRRVTAARQAAPVTNRPLRVLFMAASPLDLEPVLRFEHEESLILSATGRYPTELVVEESGSLTGLGERVQTFGAGHFDVAHLSGHAKLIDGEPAFLMADDVGRRAPAGAEDLARAFAGQWPRLVFLSGCSTGRAPDQGRLPSLCEALVRAGAPAVLGWALPVGDQAASDAAAKLYEQLALGKGIDEAVARARQRLLEKGSPYWHLLRLYADATPFVPLVTAIQCSLGSHSARRQTSNRLEWV